MPFGNVLVRRKSLEAAYEAPGEVGGSGGLLSANKPFMRLHGARLLDAGFHIIPIAPSKKYPGEYMGGRWVPMSSWSRFSHHKPSEATVDMWANWPGSGVGIVTGGGSGVIGIDIDRVS